jgi:hypothetical protein
MARRPSGLRGKLALALGKHKGLASQITNTAGGAPIPAGFALPGAPTVARARSPAALCSGERSTPSAERSTPSAESAEFRAGYEP